MQKLIKDDSKGLEQAATMLLLGRGYLPNGLPRSEAAPYAQRRFESRMVRVPLGGKPAYRR